MPRTNYNPEEFGNDPMYIRQYWIMACIANCIPLRRIRKVCGSIRYLAYRTFRSTTTFEGTGGDAPSKTLACKNRVVRQKIGLECSGFSVSLRNISYSYAHGSAFSTPLKTAKLTQDHSHGPATIDILCPSFFIHH